MRWFTCAYRKPKARETVMQLHLNDVVCSLSSQSSSNNYSVLQSLPITRQLHTSSPHTIHTRTQILNPQHLLLINPLSPSQINPYFLLPLLQSSRLHILTPRMGLFLLSTLNDVVHDLSDETLARLIDDSWTGSCISSATRTAAGGSTGGSVTSAHFF